MVVCNLHLLSLIPGITYVDIISVLKRKSIKPLLQARVVRWIILPSKTSTAPLLAHNIHWDMLIILPGDGPLPLEVRAFVRHAWSANIGVPSTLLKDYAAKNTQLLRPAPGTVKPAERYITNSSTTQTLELSPELARWVSQLDSRTRTHPVSMLNLLKFVPGRREQYKKYGAEFGQRVGSRHGGNAKIVAHVVGSSAKEQGWDEVAVAHYPSLEHFAAMIGSRDYQEVNREFRLGSLEDTFILCTQEIADDGALAGGRVSESRM